MTIFEKCVLLGYYAASGGNSLPTFRDILSVPSSRVTNARSSLYSWPLKMGSIGCPETSVRNYHHSQRNSPEELSSCLLRSVSLKSRMITYFLKGAKFFLLERKRSGTKLAEECCWAITHVAGQSYRGRSGSRVLKFGFKLTTVYGYSIPNYTKFDWRPKFRNVTTTAYVGKCL